jgi:hypothetical protein
MQSLVLITKTLLFNLDLEMDGNTSSGLICMAFTAPSSPAATSLLLSLSTSFYTITYSGLERLTAK